MPKEKPAATANVEEQLKKLEVERNQAMVREDLATLDQTYRERLHSDQPVWPAREQSADAGGLRSGDLKYQSIEVEDVTVRLYGDTAILSGCRNVKGQHRGKDISGKDRFTRVYVKRNGQWQAVWFQ